MMKNILMLLFLFSLLETERADAQNKVRLFQPVGWEQANLIAARENKLVLVEVGHTGRQSCAAIEKDRNTVDFLLRQVVAMHMDGQEVVERGFERRMLLYPWPCYAFFMPYGDLVGVVAADQAERNPGKLRDAFLEARKLADRKKRNSRSVVFQPQTLEEAMGMGMRTDRNLFVYLSAADSQPCLLMEKNVFNLDSVADFYNRHFVNIRLSDTEAVALGRKYGAEVFPGFLFLTPKGKLLFKEEGYAETSSLLDYGKKALKKASGIPFEQGTTCEFREKARLTGKLIFTDCHMGGSSHQQLLKTVFSEPEVTDFFGERFINVQQEGRLTALIFSDAEGRMVHRVTTVGDAAALLEEAARALTGKGLGALQVRFLSGDRDTAFLENYMVMAARAGMDSEAGIACKEYFRQFPPECLKDGRKWKLFSDFSYDCPEVYMDYLWKEKQILAGLYGEENFNNRINRLWIATTARFVRDSVFDEDGFKACCRELKKRKIKGSRLMIRVARMEIAERVGDWKTYVELAEERWMEEKITDMELFRWGEKVYENCTDANACYKMALGLVSRVRKIQEKEALTGRIRMSSYKGFLAKLADDLFKKGE